MLGGRERPANVGVLLREALAAVNDSVIARLAERGHGVVRPAHGAVFQHLDDTGTTVSLLAERAQMTKQAMAELVGHLERHGYVERVPHHTDRRAKLVLPTERGRDVIVIAQRLAPQLEDRLRELLGPDRFESLRTDLQAIPSVVAHSSADLGVVVGTEADEVRGRATTTPRSA
ncbi:MAG TPA: MarR family transcriptional regulator [Actinoplanes sp.]|jgi:DNA-binding MarR family transcriptional regulator